MELSRGTRVFGDVKTCKCTWLPGDTTRVVIQAFSILVIMVFLLNAWFIQHTSSKTARSYIPGFSSFTRDAKNTTDTFISYTKTDNTHRHLNQQGKIRNCSGDFKKKHLMTIPFSGRTGNILFELAALLALSNMTCYTAIIKPGGVTHLDQIFDLKNVIRTRFDEKNFKVLKEPGYATYDVNITSRITPDSNWRLNGYFQSFRYFENHVDLVRSSFLFKESIKNAVREYLNDKMFRNKIKVCLHARRGDILAARKRLVSDSAFFTRAIFYMRNYLSPLNFELIVLSDSMAWCKQNIKGEYVHYSPFSDAGKDLYLLTQCDHNIITHGTFGWMGAWLNETGVVIFDRILTRGLPGFTFEDHFFSHWIPV